MTALSLATHVTAGTPVNLLSLSFHTCKTGIKGLERIRALRLLKRLLHGERLGQYPRPHVSVYRSHLLGV